MQGLSPKIAQLCHLPHVTDVLINGHQDIWVDRGCGLEKVDYSYQGDARRLAMRLASLCGKRLDDACPIVDGVLPDGTRLHAVLSPISTQQALISLRINHQETFNLDQLRHSHMMDNYIHYVLGVIIQARLSLFISGATGSGKTTLLAAMLSRAGREERIICIEEVSELHPHHPHVVHLQERKPNIQGRGHVSMSDLVRAAMRMRPDRIVLGECRGEEVKDVLSAMNTGHEGSCATIHANTAMDVPARLVALGALAGLSRSAIYAQASAAIDVVIHVERRLLPDGTLRRWVSHIAIPVMEGESLVMLPAITCDINGTTTVGPGMGYIENLCHMRAVPLLKQTQQEAA